MKIVLRFFLSILCMHASLSIQANTQDAYFSTLKKANVNTVLLVGVAGVVLFLAYPVLLRSLNRSKIIDRDDFDKNGQRIKWQPVQV